MQGAAGDGGGAEEERKELCEAVLVVSGTRLRSPSEVVPGQDAQPFPSSHEGGSMALSPTRGLQGPPPLLPRVPKALT